jgi:hypothetical protein
MSKIKTIAIDSIKKYKIANDEILVLKLPDYATNNDANAIAEHLEKEYPEIAHKILITFSDFKIAKYKNTEE